MLTWRVGIVVAQLAYPLFRGLVYLYFVPWEPSASQ
jgi:hypothetical protein